MNSTESRLAVFAALITLGNETITIEPVVPLHIGRKCGSADVCIISSVRV
jgi:hypothetical protein